MNTVICLMGPTASGKTQLAVDLVQHFPLEIISVDSAMVYRGMNIGTAKPSKEILAIAPHHLIDIRDPAETYSAAQFCEDALREIKKIIAKGKIPLLVGGTMLYFRALQKGLSEMPSSDPLVRQRLQEELKEKNLEAMHQRLKKIDPQAAERIHPHDTQRILRALEVYDISGKNLTAWQIENKAPLAEYSIYNLALAPKDRKILHERIAERFKKMLADGFVDEVRALFARKDLTINTPAIRSVGYRQVWEYLSGNLSYEEMQERGIIATRQLAKRQLTWLRNWPGLIWFDSEEKNLVEKILSNIPLN